MTDWSEEEFVKQNEMCGEKQGFHQCFKGMEEGI